MVRVYGLGVWGLGVWALGLVPVHGWVWSLEHGV